MTTIDTARALAEPVYDVGGRFMLDGATFVRGAELGLDGMAFYFVGRAGVLGDVDAQVVTDQFGVFEPATVEAQWVAGTAVMPAADAAAEFIACGHLWGRTHLPDDLDAARLAELAYRIADTTRDRDDDAIPALFAAWRDVERPDTTSADGARAAALHALHLLRELRGGLHVQELQRAGLAPHHAVLVRQGPSMAALFGWPEPHADVDDARADWQAAEDRTDERMAELLEVLDDAEQAELVELVRSTV